MGFTVREIAGQPTPVAVCDLCRVPIFGAGAVVWRTTSARPGEAESITITHAGRCVERLRQEFPETPERRWQAQGLADYLQVLLGHTTLPT
jgi:hypothetical protein